MISEHTQQTEVIKWCKKNNIFIFSIPNGFNSNAINAKIMKAEGLLKGIPDLCILLPNKCFFIEMKTDKGVVSVEQAKIHQQLRELGYTVYVAYNTFEAVKFIKQEIERLKNK